MKRLLFSLLLLSAAAFGQGSVVTGTPTVTNPLGQPIAGATVAVCNTDPGSPTAGGCPGHLATLYTDITIGTACTGTAGAKPLSNPGGIGSGCSNPGLTDGQGNVVAFTSQGQYWCEYYGGAIIGIRVIPCIFPSTSGAAANALVVTPTDYGAKADVVTLTDGAITSGTKNFTSVAATFGAADVGKAIVVRGAGASSADLVTTIAAFVSSTAVTLTASAGTTASAALTYYGTDDTAAIKACVAAGTAVGGHCTLNNGKTFMMSNAATTIRMSATGPGGILDGTGTVIFAPSGTLTGGNNDRFLYITSTEATPIQIAAGAIAKAATSFTAQNAGDVSSWAKGDWVILCEKDATAGDCLFVDWMQVSSIAGTTVNVITPFRMAFPNSRTWNVSGIPAACVVASPCGLSARKVTGITNATLRDFHLISPNITDGTSKATGIVTRDTRGVTIDNVQADCSAQNCLSTYLDQGLTLKNFRTNHATTLEIAGTVDFNISGLQSQLVGTALNGYIAPAGQCYTLDYGSGFGTVSNSNCGPTLNSSMYLNAGVHDVTVNTSTIGWVKGTLSGAAIQCVSCYRVIETSNVLSGGDGLSTGISFLDGTYTVALNSDSNQATGNMVNGFPTNYSCSATNGTDNCDDYSSTVAGLRLIRNSIMSGVLVGEGDVTLANGANNNIAHSCGNGANCSYIRIIGPTGAFSVSGFTGGSNGRMLYVFNSTTQAMTITNEATSTAANRITTLTGADVTLRAGTSYATFIYDSATSRWKLVSTN